MMSSDSCLPEQILDLWFPKNGFWESRENYRAWIEERMQGGMDAIICEEYADVTASAARGELDHWAQNAEGRIALLIVLDQFPRSLWRDTPAAYAQDIKANHLVLEGLTNGHVATVAPWKKLFCAIALAHCEGVDHLHRLSLSEKIIEDVIAEYPPQLAYSADLLRSQAAKIRGVIEHFGRHPHRNAHLGRVSSAEEQDYIAAGDFPHAKKKAA